jgi:hypothetical protein
MWKHYYCLGQSTYYKAHEDALQDSQGLINPRTHDVQAISCISCLQRQQRCGRYPVGMLVEILFHVSSFYLRVVSQTQGDLRVLGPTVAAQVVLPDSRW